MSKTVLVIVATKPQIFPLGTAEGLFSYVLTNSKGDVLSSVESASSGASFPLVPEGDFVMTVTKNGVSASQAFTIVADNVTINVPDTLTLTFS